MKPGESFKFERMMNHPGKGMTGIELEESEWYDEIMFIRALEQNKEDVVKNPHALFPVVDKEMIRKLIKDYDDGFSKLSDNYIRVHIAKQALDFCFVDEFNKNK